MESVYLPKNKIKKLRTPQFTLETVHFPKPKGPYSILKNLVRHYVFHFCVGAIEKCYKQYLYFV